jgi:hypothetical protein
MYAVILATVAIWPTECVHAEPIVILLSLLLPS